VIHRNITSSNIFVNSRMKAKLSDFTTSRELADFTMTARAGTMNWMAPEVLSGEKYDNSVDIYSLGIVLTELENRIFPFSDECKNGRPLAKESLTANIVKGNLRPTLSGECPGWYRELVMHCVSANPMDRPDAMEVARRIQEYIQ